MDLTTAIVNPAAALDQGAARTANLAASIDTARPLFTTFCLIGADALALGISVGLSTLCKLLSSNHSDLSEFGRLWPFLFVFFAVFTEGRLYSLAGLSAPEELRRSTVSSALLLTVLFP